MLKICALAYARAVTEYFCMRLWSGEQVRICRDLCRIALLWMRPIVSASGVRLSNPMYPSCPVFPDTLACTVELELELLLRTARSHAGHDFRPDYKGLSVFKRRCVHRTA